MNRLQKKCFIVSASLHGLLFVVLLFGSALSWHRDKPLPPALNIINIDPKLLTDAPTSGGDPTVRAAAPAPAAPVLPPAATPPPQPVVVPKPPVPAARDLPPVPKPLTPVKPVAQPAPVVVKPAPKVVTPPKPTLTAEEIAALKKPSVRPAKDAAQAEQAAQQAAAAKKYADNQKRIANAFSQSMANLSKGPAASVEIKPFNSQGDGGPMAANYRDVVGSKYKSAWTPPPGLTDELATATASVTIDRDGRVTSARITKGSGNPGMDKSVQTTLDNVTFIGPFPSGSNDQERTYEIQFNLKAKLSSG